MFAKKITNVVKDPGWAGWAAGTGPAPGGATVTPGTATQLLTVYGCVTRIADVMGTMPVDHYTRHGGVQTEVASRAGWLDRPNVDQLWSTFVIQSVWSLLIDGNLFVAPIRDGMGRVRELWVIDPAIVHVGRIRPGAPASYTIGGTPYAGELLHLPAYLPPGHVRGVNPIDNARISLGLGLAAQQYGKGFFDNSGIPAVVITTPGTTTPEQKKEIRDNWALKHSGPGRSGGVGVLDSGGSIQQLTIAPEQAQFLESRRFSAAEISANLFHVPPDMVGVALEGSSLTYQNMETRWTEFIRSACQRWMTSIELAFSWQFLPRPQFIKFVPDVYLRADTKGRYDAHKVGIDAGFLTDDEAREFEDLPPLTPEQRQQIAATRKPAAKTDPAMSVEEFDRDEFGLVTRRTTRMGP